MIQRAAGFSGGPLLLSPATILASGAILSPPSHYLFSAVRPTLLLRHARIRVFRTAGLSVLTLLRHGIARCAGPGVYAGPAIITIRLPS
jgi:hypothetical protein